MIVRTIHSFCCHLRETYVKTKTKTKFYENTMQKASFETLKKFFNYLPLYWIYWGMHNDCLGFFINLLPQLIKFNIRTNGWISLPVFVKYRCLFLKHSKSHYKSVKFSFWVSVVLYIIESLLSSLRWSSLRQCRYCSREATDTQSTQLRTHCLQMSFESGVYSDSWGSWTNRTHT